MLGNIETESAFQDEKSDAYFRTLYGNEAEILLLQKARYQNMCQEHQKFFGKDRCEIFSAPGRTEICGNHTDHNHGKVLAASVTLDCVGVASKTDTARVRIHDLSYAEDFEMDCGQLYQNPDENGTMALVRGILAGFVKEGFCIGGFDLSITSDVIPAAGVSSSAAFEMLICKILDTFYNKGSMNVLAYAKIGKYAENYFWYKQSGLLDQMTCALGGMVHIDFADVNHPQVEKIDFDFSAQNYDVLLVNTGGHHANLREEYSAIPAEMKKVAGYFGAEVLRDVPYENFLEKIEEIREKTGDRAVLRALHFYEENKRVDAQAQALLRNDFEAFLEGIRSSGNSSWKCLQNCYVDGSPQTQGIAYFLALTELFLSQKNAGAARVHGGGFAGTIAVYLPINLTQAYIRHIEGITKRSSIFKMSIRNVGVVSFSELTERKA